MSKFLKFIVNLFLTVAILTAAAILVPPLLGVNTTIVDSAGMDTNLPLGSVTYSVDVPVTKLQNGDEILKENGTSTYAYIIEDGDVATGKYKVSSAVDRESVSEITIRNTISLVKLSIPYIGYVVVAMQTVEGIIIIVLVVLFIIILFVLSELWKSRDDDDDDDDSDDYNGGNAGYESLSSGNDVNGAAIEQDFREAQGISEESEVEQGMMYEQFPEQPKCEDDIPVSDQAAYPSSGMYTEGGDYTGNVSDSVYYGTQNYSEDMTGNGTDPDTSYEKSGSDIGAAAFAAGAAGAIGAAAVSEGEEDKFGTWNTTDMNFAMELERGLADKSAADEASVIQENTVPEAQGTYEAAYEPQIGQKVDEDTWTQEPDFEAAVFQTEVPEQPVYTETTVPEYTAEEVQTAPAEEPVAAAYDSGADSEEELEIALEPNQFIAARRLSLEEILEQARKRGDEPKVSKDEVSGVSIVDYSKLI